MKNVDHDRRPARQGNDLIDSMNIAIRLGILVLAGMAVLGGCASSGPLFNQMTADSTFRYGTNKLAEEDWDDAVQAFQQFTFQFPSDPRYQEARFRLGEAYFGKGEYVTSAAEFDRLASDFPSGEYSPEARLKVCQSYAELSPKPQRDQQYTQSAVDHCESLIAFYPRRTELVAQAQEIIAEMRDKLAEKKFRIGEFYLKRLKAYDSAVQYFNDTLNEYPESSVVPKVLFHLWEAYVELGYDDEASEVRERLIREHSTTDEARRLEVVSRNDDP